MRKKFFMLTCFLLVLSTFACLLTGCFNSSDTDCTSTSTPEPDQPSPSYELSYPERYTIVCMPNSSDGISSDAPDYNGILTNPNKVQDLIKENIPDKTIEVYGKTYTATYFRTRLLPLYPFEIDYFKCNGFEYGQQADTGAFTWFFIMPSLSEDSEFTPIFDSTSKEQDYIDYASDLLTDITGIDHKNYVATVEVKQNSYDISFEKHINGIPCRGENSIILTTEGLVKCVSLNLDENSYSRLESIQIDMEKVSETVQQQYANDSARYTVTSSEKPKYNLYIENDTVWLYATVKFEYEVEADDETDDPIVFIGTYPYMLKVATIHSSAP